MDTRIIVAGLALGIGGIALVGWGAVSWEQRTHEPDALLGIFFVGVVAMVFGLLILNAGL